MLTKLALLDANRAAQTHKISASVHTGPTTENRKVGGSIPSLPTRFAQLRGLAAGIPPLEEPPD
jgi:hypothetical protein